MPWPITGAGCDVAASGDDDARRLARQVAAHGFRADRQGPESVSDELFSPFYGQIRTESLDGLLIQAWRDGAIELRTDHLDAFARAHRAEMEHVLRLERAVLDVVDRLAERGITSVVLKGVALANDVYADAALRACGDVDLLVDPAQYVTAIETLVAAGAVRGLPEVRPGFDARFAKDVPVLVDGMTVDLHRTLIRGPFGERIPVAAVIGRSRPLPLGGQVVRVLDPSDAYVFAGLTAGAADIPARLITLRDLLELERAPGFAADAVREAAAHWGVEPALARGVRVLHEVLHPDPAPALLPWAVRHRPTRLERLYMSCYTATARSYRTTLATVIAIPRWSDRARFMTALVFPQRAYREARGWSRTGHLLRAITKLRR